MLTSVPTTCYMLEGGYILVSGLCPQELHLMPVSPFMQMVPNQLGMLIDSAYVSAKEEAGERLTERSWLGHWEACGLAVQYRLFLILLSWGFRG